MLPIAFGKTEKRTHDYVRHGTTNLFAALNVGTGEVIGECYPRRRSEEFLKFMDIAVAPYEGHEIHVVMDNLSTHLGDEVTAWLAEHPKDRFHYTPTGQFVVEPGAERSNLYVRSSRRSSRTSRTGTAM